MKTELTQQQILAVRCPTCKAVPGARCTLSLGHPRNKPHATRICAAEEAKK